MSQLYRLLALDLDGTSVEGGRAPAPSVVQSVATARERGVHVILATGRPFGSAARYAHAFRLDSPLICFQGALVKAMDGTRRTLFSEPVAEEALRDVAAFAEEQELELTLYSESAIYLSRMSYPQDFYDLWFGAALNRVNRLVDGLAEIRSEGLVPLKGLFIGEPAANDALVNQLLALFGDRLNVVRSHPLFVEVTSPKATKGAALAFLADHLGIPQAATIAVGDSGNDLSMVRWAGLGVAVANATPDVLAAADWIAPSVTQDGVVTVIEQFLLHNGRG
jgi:Cof subfamily protein (haloacid dehalogenase superfamily)